MAKDSILQFPTIMSSGINTEDAVVIAKALERQYASFLLTVFSLNNSVNYDLYGGVLGFIKSIHNNENIPDVISYGSDLISTANEIKSLESATEMQTITTRDIMECWNCIDDEVESKSLNDIYLPETKFLKAMETYLGDKVDDAKNVFNDIKTGATPDPKHNKTGWYRKDDKDESREGGTNVSTQETKEIVYKMQMNKDGSLKLDKNNKPMFELDKNGQRVPVMDGKNPKMAVTSSVTTTIKQGSSKSATTSPYTVSANSPAIIRNDKITMLEPTMMEVQFIMHGSSSMNGGAANVHLQNVIIGIKSMIRLVSPNIMIPNMIDSVEGSRNAFKFIKWTQGEFKFIRDLIFGISSAKDEAIKSKTASRWWAALKKRKRNSKLFMGNQVKISPISTIVMTAQEVEEVKNATNLDLRDPSVAIKMMDNLFLLGFMIYDSETEIVSSLFDGFDEFADMTIGSLRTNNGKDIDMTQAKEFLKLIGKV
jgi:hypothetical protein